MGFLDYQDSDAKKSQWFDLSIDLHKFQALGWYQYGSYQTSSYGEQRVLLSRWSIINSIIWNIGRSVFYCEEQNWQKFHNVSRSIKLLIEALIEKMEPLFMGDNWEWVWMSRKTTNRRFLFGNFGLLGLWCNGQNQLFLTSILFYRCFLLDWVLDGGLTTCSGWGNQVSKLSEKSKGSTFGKILTVKTLMQAPQLDNSPIKKFCATEKFSMPNLMEEIKPAVLVKCEV